MAACAKKQGAGVRIRSGLVAEYRFNEGVGQTLTDYSGNANHGTLGSTAGVDTNDPTWSASGASFTTDDYINCGAIDVGGATQTAYTFSVVFYTGSAIGTGSGTTIPFGLATSADTNNYGFIRFCAFTGLLTNEIVTIVNTTAGAFKSTAWCDATATIGIGWHVLTVVWNGSSYDIYLDTEKKTTATNGTHAPLIPLSGLMLGAAWYNTAISGFATISIANVCVYARSLTVAELSNNYAYLKSYLKNARGISLP